MIWSFYHSLKKLIAVWSLKTRNLYLRNVTCGTPYVPHISTRPVRATLISSSAGPFRLQVTRRLQLRHTSRGRPVKMTPLCAVPATQEALRHVFDGSERCFHYRAPPPAAASTAPSPPPPPPPPPADNRPRLAVEPSCPQPSTAQTTARRQEGGGGRGGGGARRKYGLDRPDWVISLHECRK